MRKTNFSHLRWLILLILPVFGACATTGEPPTATLSKAELAVDNAAETQAPQYAPLELRKARSHIQQARQAVDQENYEEAQRLAEKALVEAQLAQAKADAQVAQNTLAEMRDSIDTIRREAERSLQQQQPAS